MADAGRGRRPRRCGRSGDGPVARRERGTAGGAGGRGFSRNGRGNCEGCRRGTVCGAMWRGAGRRCEERRLSVSSGVGRLGHILERGEGAEFGGFQLCGPSRPCGVISRSGSGSGGMDAAGVCTAETGGIAEKCRGLGPVRSITPVRPQHRREGPREFRGLYACHSVSIRGSTLRFPRSRCLFCTGRRDESTILRGREDLRIYRRSTHRLVLLTALNPQPHFRLKRPSAGRGRRGVGRRC